MEFLYILGAIAALLLIAVAAITLICFHMAFYVPKKQILGENDYPIPEGEIYEPHRDLMIRFMKEARSMPRENVCIRSFDGLNLHGTYYEYAPGAPIELMFHGYRGCAERDLSGGVQRCFALGHSALIVDQRACGRSDGKVITFGIHERKDCLKWIDFMMQKFGPEVKIILTGISMGAATVMMAGGEALPSNVIGILADCGYTSPKEIIKVVIKQMKLPAEPAYPFVKLAAKLLGGFDLEETSALEAMKKCRVPVIFFHGEADDFVPCYMSRQCYEACASKKQLVTMKDAGHGLCYLADAEGYIQAARDFFHG